MHARAISVAMLLFAALAACGRPTDDVGPVATEPATSESAIPTTLTSSTTTSTVAAADPTLSLQLCDDVPLIATSVTGNDPTGSGFNPVFDGVLLTYTQEHATFGGMWLDRAANGTMVLAFTDDPAAHREALAQRRPSPDDVHPIEPMPAITDDRPIGEWGIAFDVVQVAYTETELIANVGVVLDAALALDLPMNGAGVDTMRNRINLMPSLPVTMDEAVAIEAAISNVAALEMVCLEGTIVDSRPDPIEPGTPLEVIVLPDADGTYPADTEVQCAGAQFTLGDLQSLTPIDEADPGLKAVVDGWVNGPGGSGWPVDGWVVLTETDSMATLILYTDATMYSIGAEARRNGWLWAGAAGGQACDVALQLPHGMGDVSWILDPDFPSPDATSTEIHVLATERACTGGTAVGDRLLGPQVVETADSVRIAFAAIPLVGAQNCPGNPPTAVTVTLERPLGDRPVIDGLVIGPLSTLALPAT